MPARWAGFAGILDVAAHLALRTNGAAELVNRAVGEGCPQRCRHPSNRRQVHLQLTATRADRLAALSYDQLDDLDDLDVALSVGNAD